MLTLLVTFGAFCVAAALVCLQQWRQAEVITLELNSLRGHAPKAFVPTQSGRPVDDAMILPAFDSAALVDTFNYLATNAGLPVDEVSYALEDGTAQPYLRYRVTLTVASNYPTIRGFVDQLKTELPHVALDSISCSRDDIAQASLSCDLAFSAFFQKGVHG